MNIDLEGILRQLDRRVRVVELLAAGGLVLAGFWMLGRWVRANALAASSDRAALEVALQDLELDVAERKSLRDWVSRDFARAKESAATLSRSRRLLFEGGLAVSEEKRLLEKQLEIMSLWIRVDQAADKAHLIRGEQIAESLPLSGARVRAVGAETRALPGAGTIASKERFASTERPRSEQVGGQLQWEPPQVGTSQRASALGEFVMFTKEGIIIHGPPLKVAEHEAFAHLCLSLPIAVARRLYAQSFVGTKIQITDTKL
ncbi:MAG: L,D-transpeptidase [Elusimicrobia bacterium]|nr:L,D-transpeptidase [Elusimicrobiota bacterium]